MKFDEIETLAKSSRRPTRLHFINQSPITWIPVSFISYVRSKTLSVFMMESPFDDRQPHNDPPNGRNNIET